MQLRFFYVVCKVCSSLFSLSSISSHTDIRAEMMPDSLPDRSEVTKFDVSKLKHVETEEKDVLPSKSGLKDLFSEG